MRRLFLISSTEAPCISWDDPLRKPEGVASAASIEEEEASLAVSPSGRTHARGVDERSVPRNRVALPEPARGHPVKNRRRGPKRTDAASRLSDVLASSWTKCCKRSERDVTVFSSRISSNAGHRIIATPSLPSRQSAAGTSSGRSNSCNRRSFSRSVE